MLGGCRERERGEDQEPRAKRRVQERGLVTQGGLWRVSEPLQCPDNLGSCDSTKHKPLRMTRDPGSHGLPARSSPLLVSTWSPVLGAYLFSFTVTLFSQALYVARTTSRLPRHRRLRRQ